MQFSLLRIIGYYPEIWTISLNLASTKDFTTLCSTSIRTLIVLWESGYSWNTVYCVNWYIHGWQNKPTMIYTASKNLSHPKLCMEKKTTLITGGVGGANQSNGASWLWQTHKLWKKLCNTGLEAPFDWKFLKVGSVIVYSFVKNVPNLVQYVINIWRQCRL